jgi:hypothetical protein
MVILKNMAIIRIRAYTLSKIGLVALTLFCNGGIFLFETWDTCRGRFFLVNCREYPLILQLVPDSFKNLSIVDCSV